ncbi:MAG TPA: sulfatase [Verrucomicrobiae bacterium]|nr:sulfatase [Verrucomicrobiae bacterium]
MNKRSVLNVFSFMSFRSLASSCGLVFSLVLAMNGSSGLITSAFAAESSSQRPNILFILTDDQRWDTMGCAGNKIIHTPEMDRLARDGVRFDNAFVTTAICAASRASIFTGLYERTHRFTFRTPPLAPRFCLASYPALLRRAGYRTGFVGKLGVDLGGTTNRDAMFDSCVPLHRTPYWKKQPDGSERHLTDIEGDNAIAFIESTSADQPFCLSVSFNAPHAEDNDPKQYYWQHECDDLYKDAVMPVPWTMTDEFFSHLPIFLQTSESRVRWHWRFDEPAKFQDMVKGYYRMISGVDMVIGRIRKALDDKGVADNTVIIFTGDNGYFLGERGFADKWYIYEYSIRVPLIVYDPRAPASRRGVVEHPDALNVDLAPTMLDLAGVRVPSSMQGRSLVPLLKGSTPKDWRTEFFYEHLFDHERIPKSEGLRTDRWTYVRWFQEKPMVEELYDHTADFDEAHDLSKVPKYADLLAQMRQRTTEYRNKYGGPYVPNPRKPKTKAHKVKRAPARKQTAASPPPLPDH